MNYFKKDEADILFIVRDLRNAAAHSHCLFSKLIKEEGVSPLRCVSQYVATIEDISPSQRKARLSSKCLNDFVTLLYAFQYFVDSEGIIGHTEKQLKYLFYERMPRHKEYFAANPILKGAYNFTIKILDKLLKRNRI